MKAFLAAIHLFILVYLMVDVNAYTLLRVNQGLNTFFQKDCPGREAHWLNIRSLSGYLISIENSRCLCGVTSCHDLPSGVSWSHAPGQESGRE